MGYDAAQPLATGFMDTVASAVSLLGRRDVALIIAGVAVAVLLALRRIDALIPMFLPIVLVADGLLMASRLTRVWSIARKRSAH